jgi:hypothetical protein
MAAIKDALFPAGQPLGNALPPADNKLVGLVPVFQPGAAVCEDYLGERQWRGFVTRLDGQNYWVRIVYSHKKGCYVGREYAFPTRLLKSCQNTSTVEVPYLYWLGHQPSVRPLPAPQFQIPSRSPRR